MAYVYPQDAPVGEAMCKQKRHHWHMVKAKAVKCCRCGTQATYRGQESEGPHDDKGDN